MAKDLLSLLKENKQLIILTEIVGFLHDLGKLDNKCYEDHNERIRAELDFKLRIKESYEDVIEPTKIPEIILSLVTTPLKSLNRCLPEILSFLCKSTEIPTILSPLFWHHYYGDFEPRNNFEKLIANADSQDSNEDRGVQEESSPCQFYIATPFGFEELLDNKIKDKLHELGVKDRTECRLRFYYEFAEILNKITYKENEEIKFKDGENLWREFRNKFYEIVEKYFPLSLAETRRPSNDINLFDHCYMTGSISKVGIVGFILNEKLRDISQDKGYRFRFKLLVVGFNGYNFLTKVNRLPDFLGRFEKLDEIRKKIREIVEFEIPIGNLVYEDLNIMCFLIPELLEDGNEIIKEVKKKIVQVVTNETNGIIAPIVKVYGKDNQKGSEYIGPLIERAKAEINKKITAPYFESDELANLPWVKNWKKKWMCFNCQNLFDVPDDNKCPKCSSKRIKQREKCYVCGYAPEYPVSEGIVSTKGERLCEYCFNLRREGIMKRRIKGETIWLDQVRDESNRIALIVGKLWPIEKWLSGELVRKSTFNVLSHPIEGKSKKEKLKSQIWKIKGILRGQTKLYNQVKDAITKYNAEALTYLNLKIDELSKLSEENQNIEIPALVDELIKKCSGKSPSPSRLRRVWKEFEEFSDNSIEIAKEFFKDKKRKQLILKVNKELKEEMLGKSELGTVISGKNEIRTIDYLDCIKNDKKLDDLSEEEIKTLLLKEEVEVEWEDGRKGRYKIEDLKIEYYIPVVKIYTTAGEFMFLCPAKHALAIITRIKSYFFRRFNKALGKLSLNLGPIYFKYKQPLYLVLDAGRRLLKEFESEDLRKMDKEKHYEIKRSEDVFIIDELGWSIVPKFGDGSDDWYYCTIRDIAGEYKSMIEANGDKIMVYHNFFDYEYLESTQKRFDIFLRSSKRYHPILKNAGPRPYLLEELEKIIKLWEILNPENGKFTKSQIMKIMYVCSDKIREWKESGLVKDFTRSTVDVNIKLRGEEKDFLIGCINDGSFFDTIELFIKLEQELSPFDVISFFVDFQYDKGERMRAEKWLLLQGGSDASP